VLPRGPVSLPAHSGQCSVVHEFLCLRAVLWSESDRLAVHGPDRRIDAQLGIDPHPPVVVRGDDQQPTVEQGAKVAPEKIAKEPVAQVL